MRILVDTNVILDSLLYRQPFFEVSDRIVKYCAQKKFDGFVAAHTVTNAFYVLKKQMSNKECRAAVKRFLTFFKVVPIDGEKIFRALINENFKDFEDRLQIECAIAIDADYIITRDKNDFVGSEISCITPGEFCDMFKS